MLTIQTTGDWARGSVRIAQVPATRRIEPEVESLIESAWKSGRARLGERLFDGEMCRMESWRASRERLDLSLSLTSYRIFFGTNLNNPTLADRFGREVLANPVGVGSALLTSDGWLLYGRRSAGVAYYPHRVHPFAGSIEQRDGADVFAAVERELHEELRLAPADIESMRCLGIVEDNVIRHPELIFHTRLRLTRAQIESQVPGDEHASGVAIEATREAVERVLANPSDFTPVAIGSLALFGRSTFGEEWVKRSS